MEKFDTVVNNLLTYAHNPKAMFRLSLNALMDVQNGTGKELRDPTDPVAMLAEMGVMLSHTTIEGEREILPTIYPSMSRTHDDVYRHMSDVDYIDAFAQPSAATLMMFVDTDSIRTKAVPVNGNGVRKVIIPRESSVKVAGYTFTLQYPIEIRVLPYGTFQVVLVTDTENPISPIVSNSLDWFLTNTPNSPSELICINVPVLQYAIKSAQDTVTANTVFRQHIPFINQFFYARVWSKNTKGVWVEIPNTHAKSTYDPNIVTAVLRVGDGMLEVMIPEIYINTNKISGAIRTDIYTTLGPLSINLGNYPADDFIFTFADLNDETDSSYFSPMKNMSIFRTLSTSVTIGGRNALTFAELRERVIMNSIGARKLPITENQVGAVAADYGLTLTKPIDYVSERTFHLSAPLPSSTIKSVSSPMGTLAATMYFTWDELLALPSIKNNQNRITILPTTIYRLDGSGIKPDNALTSAYRFMPANDLINLGNSSQYFFSPFHYVVDKNNDAIDVRVYQLSKPAVKSKRFVSTNTSTELDVVTDNYELVMTDGGYILRVVTKSQKNYKDLKDEQCFAQLSYIPRGYVAERAYLNGTLVGYLDDERVWEFKLDSMLDIDRNDELIVNNFRFTSGTPTNTTFNLLNECDLFYGCTNYFPPNYERATMDTLIIATERDSMGITWEKITLHLGKVLDGLWSKSRPNTDTIVYKRYPADVMAVYTNDVIKRDENDSPVYTIVNDPVTGKDTVVMEYMHRKGEPVIDSETGEQLVHHHIGDVIFDGNNMPIIANPRGIIFRMEFAAFDARYIFANNDEVRKYTDLVTEHVVTIVTETVAKMRTQLIDKTKAYYIPITTMGYVDARMADASIVPINAEMRFVVNYYLTAENRTNSELLQVISRKTGEVISNWLTSHKTVSTSDITEILKVELSESIITVEIGGMGDRENMRVYTVLNDAAKTVIGKRLELEADGKIGLKDDINISYTRHDITR